MRLVFSNLDRPKKAAKYLSEESSLPLSKCQNVLAQSIGYRDWHDLEQSVSTASQGNSIENSNHLGIIDYVDLLSSLAKQLEVNCGALQACISKSRLVGDSFADPEDAIRVRSLIFEKMDLPTVYGRKPGVVGKLKAPGQTKGHAIATELGRPTRIITHGAYDSIVADFEFVAPRSPLPLFIPMRLYLPYGEWLQADGARVLFSRDYCPLWRLRAERSPERIEPWKWINFVSQRFFWADHTTPWNTPSTYEQAIEVLRKEGIRCTPKLVEALPILIKNRDVKTAKEAAKYLETRAATLSTNRVEPIAEKHLQ